MRTSQFERLSALDATRGIAMLLVCAAHFIDVYYDTPLKENWFLNYLLVVCKIATPSFVIVSGIVLGYLSKAKHEDLAHLRLHLLDRAILLITAGHFLIAASMATREDLVTALSRGYVTDTLGFCLLGGLIVLRYAKAPSTRLWLGLMIYLIAWVGWNEWHPDNPMLVTLRGIVLGPTEEHRSIFWFPLLPWFGVYLVGTSIGGWLGTFEKGRLSHAGKLLVGLSSLVLGSVFIANVMLFILNVPRSAYLPFFSYSKFPPGPFYVLTFGSVALLILGTLLLASKALRTSASLKLAECMGRHALSLFITQSFLYYTALYLFFSHVDVTTFPVALLLLIGSLLCVIWVSGVYERFHINRLWTLRAIPLALRAVRSSDLSLPASLVFQPLLHRATGRSVPTVRVQKT